MFVARICSFHHWVGYSYLAFMLSRTSCTDQVKNILKTAQVSLIFLQCWQYFFLPIFVLETSSGYGHSSVDGLWDDDRLARQTARSERLQLTVLFVAHCQCYMQLNQHHYSFWIIIKSARYLPQWMIIMLIAHMKIWTSPTDSTLLCLLKL